MANKSRGSADRMVNAVIAVILIAVIALAGYAIYDKMSAKIAKQAIENGEQEATVEYLAEAQNMSVEDYLAMYGLSGISKKATEEEMTDQMTVDNYVKYASTTIEDLTTQYHLDEAPAGDSNWGELRKSFTVKNIVGETEDELNQFKEIYGLDDSVTLDTPWSEAEVKIEESIARMQEEMANATAAPSAEATQEPAQESDEAAAEHAE